MIGNSTQPSKRNPLLRLISLLQKIKVRGKETGERMKSRRHSHGLGLHASRRKPLIFPECTAVRAEHRATSKKALALLWIFKCHHHNVIYLNVVVLVFNFLFFILEREEKTLYFPGGMKQLRMVYLGNFKTFIIYLKTKYDKSVLSIVCQSKVWSCHNVTTDHAY